MQVQVIGAIVFWALAILTVAGAALVAFSRNIVHSAFGLLAAFFGVAGLFVFLSADFVGMVQLLVYVGGVVVLFLFAVMLTGRIEQVEISNLSRGPLPALAVLIGTVAVLAVVAFQTPWGPSGDMAAEPTTAAIGNALLSQYLLPFEIASVLLVAALIGSVLLASRRKEDELEDQATAEATDQPGDPPAAGPGGEP
ncbi:MAG: NADH-quinone oxidoreductase subunit J [Bradymonadales bacterium]|nr:NADH-quinone oxidoreductase subunit J [Bradymonadales bacterium]